MKHKFSLRRLRNKWVFFLCCLVGMISMTQQVEAGLRDSPYVTFSPDGNAFTTNADETDTEWYESDKVVYTGNESTLHEPEDGEHFYPVIVKGDVRVGKWIVEHKPARCIHDRDFAVSNYHGVPFSKEICHRTYYSGWMAYCAECGQKVTNNYFYMSEDAAASIKVLDMSLAYYYRCPWCTHLEQGHELAQHVCKDISANQYSVRYHANFGKGYMPKSIHMYNNSTIYEGREITPQKTLTLNSYTRIGYEFVGWNTAIDGSGESFTDGAEILNLCAEEQASIILYAQWRKSQSTLVIDPGGGTYQGSTEVCRVTGQYGSSYVLNPGDVDAPKGAVVHFETNGGGTVSDIVGEMEFFQWSFRQPFHGSMQGNIYTYEGRDGEIDYATAVYGHKPIVLPECEKEGSSFGGWYFDKEATLAAGSPGDEIKITEDVTLYAHWVDLKLEAEDNYLANGGSGAVDLCWEQNDNLEKTYLLYQKEEGHDWEKIHTAEDVSVEKHIQKECFYTGQEESYTIPYTGYYRITLYGAQGESYESFSGGKGGMVSAVIFFKKGEKLTYCVGGQNGYNGGGTGTLYGNGGGYTGVSASGTGMLLIAGGGGGATSLSEGQAGGSGTSNVEGHQGQDGMAGGGGGYQGGTSGSAVIHEHTGACIHDHIGSSSIYGGCYTQREVCGNASFKEEKYKEIFYYGNIDNDGNFVYCVRCGSYSCPGHLNEYFKYQCNVCKTVYWDWKPEKCTSYKYVVDCAQKEGYTCGYEDGEVMGATASYGGSNYIKKERCLTYEEKTNVNEGDGRLLVEAVHIGFIEDNSLIGVNAADHAAPEAVNPETVKIKAIDENKVNVIFDKPSDNGTVYYHMAESYDRSSHQKISTSNQTKNTLTSGVKGYYYKLDECEKTEVTKSDHYSSDSGENPYIGVIVEVQTQYLHIAAVDKAGNLSETIHIPLSSHKIIFWPVVTEQVVIGEGENVYQKESDYYVKADGTSPFKVSFQSRLCGTALKDYQINQLYFLAWRMSDGQEEGGLKLMTPAESVITAGTNIYRNADIRKQYTDFFCLSDASFTEARRSNYGKDIKVVQSFSLMEELDGTRIRLTPRAGVVLGNANVSSDKDADLNNSVYLIADGKGPVIEGLYIPEEIVNIKNGKWKYTIQITARDAGCGLKNFTLEVRNQDNGGYFLVEDTDGDGQIFLDISSEKAMFSGEFALIAIAQDHVGNESVETYGLDGITVDAYVEKIRDEDESAFKKGETGKLHVQTTGYIERVEVIFPEEWSSQNPSLDQVYIYEEPKFMQTEELPFMIPLQVPDAEYTIIVKAYKGDKEVQAAPEVTTITVSGSVLDEIRTRLR